MMFGKRPRETTLYILNVNLKYTKGNCQLVLGKESKGNYSVYMDVNLKETEGTCQVVSGKRVKEVSVKLLQIKNKRKKMTAMLIQIKIRGNL